MFKYKNKICLFTIIFIACIVLISCDLLSFVVCFITNILQKYVSVDQMNCVFSKCFN